MAKSPYAGRVERLQQSLTDKNCEALLVARSIHLLYLTGFTGDSSFLIVTPKRLLIVSDDRFRVQIEEECKGIESHIRGHDKNTFQAIAEVVTKLGITNLSVEASGVTLAEYERLKGLLSSVNLAPSSGLVESLRAIKDEGEIQTLRKAIQVAESAFALLRLTMQPEQTEKTLTDAIETYVRQLGGQSTAFPPIVGVGSRSALPHCPPSHRKANEDDFILVDWGAKVDFYHSDLTRVILSPGRSLKKTVEKRLKEIYTIVSEAQQKAADAIRPGVHVREVDRAARAHIEQAGYGELFNHGLGHGIGLEIHEAPSVRSNSEDVLQAGMVITLEPGIYVPDFGGVRLEDDFLITPNGVERLTTTPHHWDELIAEKIR